MESLSKKEGAGFFDKWTGDDKKNDDLKRSNKGWHA